MTCKLLNSNCSSVYISMADQPSSNDSRKALYESMFAAVDTLHDEAGNIASGQAGNLVDTLSKTIRSGLKKISETNESLATASGSTRASERIIETPYTTTIVFRDDNFFEATVATLADSHSETAIQTIGLPAGASPDEVAYIEHISPKLIILPGRNLSTDAMAAVAKRGFQSVYCFMYSQDDYRAWRQSLVDAGAVLLDTVTVDDAADKDDAAADETGSAAASTDDNTPADEDIFSPEATIAATRFYSFGVDNIYEVGGIEPSMLSSIVLEKMIMMKFPGYQSPGISRADANNLYAGIQSTGRTFNDVIEEMCNSFRGFQLEEELTLRGKIIGSYRRQIASDLVDVSGTLVLYDPIGSAFEVERVVYPVNVHAKMKDIPLSAIENKSADADALLNSVNSVIKELELNDDFVVVDSVSDDVSKETAKVTVEDVDEDSEKEAEDLAESVLESVPAAADATQNNTSQDGSNRAPTIAPTVDAPDPVKKIAAVAIPATVFIDETAKAAIGKTNKRTGDKYELAILYKYEEKVIDASPADNASETSSNDNVTTPTDNATKENDAKIVSDAVLRIVSTKPVGGYRIRLYGPAALAVAIRCFPAELIAETPGAELEGGSTDCVCWVPVSLAHQLLPFLAGGSSD